MRSAILFAGLATAATAAFGQAQEDPNAPCGVQSFGSGPPSPTDQNFEQNPIYQAISLFAPAPANYTVSFRNQTGSTSQDGYLGYYFLSSYNTTACAGYCNNLNSYTAFNIYYEPDPLLNPADNCTKPPATTNIKCSLWGQSVSAATATNNGQYREQFHVVIAGSDGFNNN